LRSLLLGLFLCYACVDGAPNALELPSALRGEDACEDITWSGFTDIHEDMLGDGSAARRMKE
jgi:hypothetical protein